MAGLQRTRTRRLIRTAWMLNVDDFSRFGLGVRHVGQRVRDQAPGIVAGFVGGVGFAGVRVDAFAGGQCGGDPSGVVVVRGLPVPVVVGGVELFAGALRHVSPEAVGDAG